jgi:hypothetical protein
MGTDEEKLAAEFQERKERIAGLLLSATRNHPPMKEDIFKILNELNELFPDLETLKDLMVNRRRERSGVISAFWWEDSYLRYQ